MIFDVVHSVPFYEGEHTYLGIGIAVGIITLLQLTGVLSWVKVRWMAYRSWSMLSRGRPEVVGVAPEVVPLAKRLLKIDRSIKEQTAVNTRLDNGQKAIVERMDEHDVKVSAIQEDVAFLKTGQTKILSMISKLFENGRDTNLTGDLIARMAEAQGVYLKDPNLSEPHDRRANDVPSA